MNMIAQKNQFDMNQYKIFKEIAQDYLDSWALPKWMDKPAKVVMVLQAWQDLWLSPTQAINGLYMVNGKISVYWETAILLMKQAWYSIEILESTSTVAIVKVSRAWISQEFKYTIDEANHAWITTGWMWIWKKYPRQMLLYKAFAFARKFFAPDCLWGYLIKEELDWEPDLANNIVDESEALEWFEKQPVIDSENIVDWTDVSSLFPDQQ